MFQSNRLYVFESCIGTRAQLGSYSRVLLPDGTPTEKIEEKAKYHYLDALRYVAQHISGDALYLPDVVAVAGAANGGWGNPLGARGAGVALPGSPGRLALPPGMGQRPRVA